MLPSDPGECLVESARAEIGVMEESPNAGKRVNEYLKTVGLPGGFFWCGAFISWLHKRCGLPTPKGAGAARAWFAPGPRLLFQRGRAGDDLAGKLQPGTVVGFYYSNLGRIGHIALVAEAPVGGGMLKTIEGNVGPDGGHGVNRNGDQVGGKRRYVRSVYSAADWRRK